MIQQIPAFHMIPPSPTPFLPLTNQFSLGQITLVAVAEQVSRQLHGHRTYFLPGGGAEIGYTEKKIT